MAANDTAAAEPIIRVSGRTGPDRAVGGKLVADRPADVFRPSPPRRSLADKPPVSRLRAMQIQHLVGCQSRVALRSL